MLVRETLAALEVAAPLTLENLTLFALLGEDTHTADYLTLEEGLAAQTARVTEVSEGGSVPELRFVNRGDTSVLLMDGEELVGAKQNRTLNISILAPAHSELLLPVTCVEAGRWAAQSAEFAASPRAHYAGGRARKQVDVTASLLSGGFHTADQSRVWEDIECKAARLESFSATSAMSEMYEVHETSVEAFVSALAAQPRQRGAVFAINGVLVGCDLFDSADTLRKLLPKIIRSYALDAVDAPKGSQSPAVSLEAVTAFLNGVAGADASNFPAIGLGEELRLQTAGLTGGALIVEGRVVHLSAFVLTAPAPVTNTEVPLRRASLRRR